MFTNGQSGLQDFLYQKGLPKISIDDKIPIFCHIKNQRETLGPFWGIVAWKLPKIPPSPYIRSLNSLSFLFQKILAPTLLMAWSTKAKLPYCNNNWNKEVESLLCEEEDQSLLDSKHDLHIKEVHTFIGSVHEKYTSFKKFKKFPKIK